MKKLLHHMLTIILILIFLFSAWKLVSALWSYLEGRNSYESLEQYISFETQPVQASEASTEAPEETLSFDVAPMEEEDDTVWPQVDFDHLQQINPDIVGWIYIEGTKINYPIVQAENNDYYLNRLFDGTRNSAGSIFMDFRCSSDFSDRHSILYGHNMKDKSMFAALINYKDPSFFRDHPVALLLTPTCNYKIQIFSGYVADSWDISWQLDLDPESFENWLTQIAEKSRFTPTSLPTEEDSVLTLSTCSYEFHDARFVLHGYVLSRKYHRAETASD